MTQEMANFITCFVAGTKILMNDGSYKPIEKIKVGEYISYKNKSYKVTNWQNQGKREVMRLIMVDGSSVVCTPNHKFLCENEDEEEWVGAKELVVQLGDGFQASRHIKRNDGSTTYPIEAISLGIKEEVFDIEVEDAHCFVLENGCVAHN